MIKITINSEESNKTIISFLKKRLRNSSLSLIYKLLRNKKIKVNNLNIRYYHHRLKEGDQIVIYDQSLKLSPPPSTKIPSASMNNIEIIYEDKNILIVVKGHNVAMHGENNSLDNAVNYYLYKQDAEKYKEKLKSYFSYTSVHRLDKLSKGLVIYPKNSEAKRILNKCIRENIIKKYLAICECLPNCQLPSVIEGFIYKDKNLQKMVFVSKEPTNLSKGTEI